MNYRTLTSAACFVSLCAAAFAGCAAEETTPSPGGNDGAGNNNNATATSTTGGVGTPTGGTPTGGTPTGGTPTGGTQASNAATNGTATTTGSAGTTATAATVAGPTTASATNATATTGATTSTTGGAGCMALAADAAAPMIDDLEDGNHIILPNGGRVGYWHDWGTAETTPLEDAPAAMAGVLHTSGPAVTGDENAAGVGVTLNDDMGACPYDASLHTGVQFTIDTNVDLVFKIGIPPTTPTADGGTCVDDSICYNHPASEPIAAGSGPIMIPFAMLAQQDWGQATDIPMDVTQLLSLQWHVAATTTGEYPAFEFTIDDISFY